MAQTSRCGNCGASVEAHSVSEDRAYYQCSCGRRWSGRAFYGRDTSCHGATAAVGGVIGTAVTGGLDGGLIGAAIGAMFGGGDTSTCIRCGGTGYVTGQNGKRKGYQCSGCNRFWTERA